MNNDQNENSGTNPPQYTIGLPLTPTPLPTIPEKPKRTTNKPLIIVIIVALLGIGGAGYYGFAQSQKLSSANKKSSNLEQSLKDSEEELKKLKDNTGESNINKSAYQSVFLKSGKVYFGKITSITETQLILEDIYYLKQNTGADTSLVKLGNEIHGPEDKMFIERKEVEFWENLKDDSKVVQAIIEYKKQHP